MEVLVAEDNPLHAMQLKESLENMGHEIIVAGDGISALNIAAKRKIKCIITDWEMPRMNGIELIRSVRMLRQTGYIYCILLTCREGDSNIIEGLNAGADDYIVKPSNSIELKFRLRAAERILELEKHLLDAAMFDKLTEIGNRRGFNDAIAKLHGHAQRYGTIYSMAIIDIDHFKKYNDTYGHQAGDEALRAVALTIKQSLRSSDSVFRYGGEEIVVLMPEQDIKGATAAAERIRTSIQSLGIQHEQSKYGVVTVSIGISMIYHASQTYDDVLKSADDALYKAKLVRNTVCASSFKKQEGVE